MQTARILLALGDDQANTVPKSGVTPGEVLTLMAIHGESAVSDIRVDDDEADTSNREEVDRLKRAYSRARNDEHKLIVETLFPGAAARVPTTFAELDLEDMMFADEAPKKAPAKKAAAKKAEAPQAPENEDDGIGEMPDAGNAALG